MNAHRIAFIVMVLALLIAPTIVYPVFLMKVMCFALFASAFNLLIGYGGLLSFGHAMFLGTAGYASAHSAKVWGFSPELGILAGTAVAALLGDHVRTQNNGQCKRSIGQPLGERRINEDRPDGLLSALFDALYDARVKTGRRLDLFGRPEFLKHSAMRTHGIQLSGALTAGAQVIAQLFGILIPSIPD